MKVIKVNGSKRMIIGGDGKTVKVQEQSTGEWWNLFEISVQEIIDAAGEAERKA